MRGVIFSIFLTLVPVLSFAADGVDARSTQVFNSVMSPYCPGVTLSSCASPDAAKLRNEIYGWVHDGTEEREIMDRLKLRFGDLITGKPEWSGSGALAWLAPVVAFLLGLGVIVTYLRRRNSRGSNQNSAHQLTNDSVRSLEEQYQAYLRGEGK